MHLKVMVDFDMLRQSLLILFQHTFMMLPDMVHIFSLQVTSTSNYSYDCIYRTVAYRTPCVTGID